VNSETKAKKTRIPGLWQHGMVGTKIKVYALKSDEYPYGAIVAEMVDGSFEEQLADAELIVSAPSLRVQRDALLAACKALTHWADDFSHADVPWPGTLNEAVNAARAAIAQAEKE